MVLFILSNPKKIGGVFQWEKFVENSVVIYDINQNFKTDDIIYVNNYTNVNFFNVKFLDKLLILGIKIYFVLHSDLCPINKFYIHFQKYFFGVISTNLHIKNKIEKLYPKIENIYMPNKLEIALEKLKKNKNSTKIKRLHYVGRLSPEKNIPMLLSAMAYIENVELYIYGEKRIKYFEFLKNLCLLLKIQNKVFFMGYFDSKNEIYDCADSVILPSVHEGLPYCLLEADAYQIPLIYNNISNIDLHIKNELNTKYVYEGYQKKICDVLYVDSYLELLKDVGYYDFKIDVISMINLNKTNKNNLKQITLLSLIMYYSEKIIVGNNYIVPPFLVSNTNKNNLYEKNVQIVANSIKKHFENISCKN